MLCEADLPRYLKLDFVVLARFHCERCYELGDRDRLDDVSPDLGGRVWFHLDQFGLIRGSEYLRLVEESNLVEADLVPVEAHLGSTGILL